MARLNRFAAASALAAAFSLAAAPATARDHHRHWHRWHHDNGIDAGDVLVGAAILGGIAVIASAASKQSRDDHTPAAPSSYPDDRQSYGYRDGDRAGGGLDRAADLCAEAVERGHDRVEAVDSVTRDGDGWAVSGALESGASFGCRVGNDGRVRGVDVEGSGRAEAASAAQGQYDDVYYARARAAQARGGADRPEWHGDAGEARPADDGRYSASQTPDFGQGA